jgi:hypothetical protein
MQYGHLTLPFSDAFSVTNLIKGHLAQLQAHFHIPFLVFALQKRLPMVKQNFAGRNCPSHLNANNLIAICAFVGCQGRIAFGLREAHHI